MDLHSNSPNIPALRPLRPRKARSRWVYSLLLLGLAAAAVYWKLSGANTGSAERYRVAQVSEGSVTSTVIASGTLQPWTVVDIKSKAGGRVDELSVEVGDVVRKGQILARIDPADSELALAQAAADLESANARRSQSVETYRLSAAQNANSLKEAELQRSIAKSSLAAAEVRLRSARDANESQPLLTQAAIRQAEAGYLAAQENRRELLAGQETERVRLAANSRQSESSLNKARAELARVEQLFERGFVSERAVEVARNETANALAQSETARSELQTLESRQVSQRTAADAQIEQAKAQLDNVRAQAVSIKNRRNELEIAAMDNRIAIEQFRKAEVAVSTAKEALRNTEIRRLDVTASIASVARAEASRTNAEKTLRDTVLRAPTDGVILQKYVEQGTIITSGQSLSSTGTSIVQIGDVSRMYVSVLVDETDISRIYVSQAASISVDAFPEPAIPGRVTRIEPKAQVEQNITTIAVRVEVDNKSRNFVRLKPAMNATCSFAMASVERSLRVPVDAIRNDDSGAYVEVPTAFDATSSPEVLVVRAMRKLRVQIGEEGDAFVEIRSGLEPGDRVLLGKVEATSNSRGSSRGMFGGGGPGGGGPPPGGMGPPGGGPGGR